MEPMWLQTLNEERDKNDPNDAKDMVALSLFALTER